MEECMMANPRIRLDNALSELGMAEIRQGMDWLIEKTSSGELDCVQALCELAEKELRRREMSSTAMFLRTAHLPFAKTFDDFDFGFQPSLNREEVMGLKYLSFVDRGDNVLFIGSPGVGKTHLASAIGVYSASQRIPTYFITFRELCSKLVIAKSGGYLRKFLNTLVRYKVLIIDEIGFLPVTAEEASLFFQLISMRYEKHSTIITTNKPLNTWAETFGDPVLTNAILDRLLHHSTVIKIIGRSYRTKDFVELQKNPAESLGIQH